MPIEIEQKAIEFNSNPTLNHLMLYSSKNKAKTLTLATLGFSFFDPQKSFIPIGLRIPTFPVVHSQPTALFLPRLC